MEKILSSPRSMLAVFIGISLYGMWQVLFGSLPWYNYIIGGATISLIPAGAALLLLNRQKKLTVPQWHTDLVKTVPQPFLFLLVLFTAIVSSAVVIPFSRITIGIIVSLLLHLYLCASLKYQEDQGLAKKSMQLIYAIYFIVVFFILLLPGLKVIFGV